MSLNPPDGKQDKIQSKSDDYNRLVELHRSGALKDYQPKTFYNSELGADYNSKYTLPALQGVWFNCKKMAGKQAEAAAVAEVGKSIDLGVLGRSYRVLPNLPISLTAPPPPAQAPVPVAVPAAVASAVVDRKPSPPFADVSNGDSGRKKMRRNDSMEEDVVDDAFYLAVSEEWHPITRMWPFDDHEGRHCVGIKFITASGMSPGSTEGIDIHAFGSAVEITADWPKDFHNHSLVNKYDNIDKLDVTTLNLLQAEEKFLKKLKHFEESTKRATVTLDLPFPVRETRKPKLKSINIRSSGLRWIRFHLESTKEPLFASKDVAEDEEFD